MFGDDDVVLNRRYTATLKCIQQGSEAYIITRADFLRMFNRNEEAWKVMFEASILKEKQLFERTNNFVSVNREDK